VFANQVPDIVFRLASFIERDNRRMLELSHAAGFAEETLDVFLRRQAPGPLHLESHFAFESRIPRPKEIAKRSDTEFRAQLKAIESHHAGQQPTGEVAA